MKPRNDLPLFRLYFVGTLAYIVLALIVLSGVLYAQPRPPASDPMSTHAVSRIGANIEGGALQRLPGNRHPLARPEFDAGAVAPDMPMQNMVLVLQSSPEQQAALDALIDAQRDPVSPYYHQWLTPQQFAEHFGASAQDVQRIANWLESRGMHVDAVAASRRSITFSGTAAQVEQALATTMRRYNVQGALHLANATDPSIPAALAPVVNGVLSLHDFRPQAAHSAAMPLPQTTYGSTHYLSPADLAAIYDVNPLHSQGIDGSGQSVAVVARWNINLSDVEAFRSSFGLPANNPQVIVNGADPGAGESGELVEATLDAEYAGALAPNATVQFVTSASTTTSDGTFLSAQYIVDHNLAPVMTMSFGLCETQMGASGNAFINSLWQQAAAQGITVLVAAGDSGAAGCDDPSSSKAQYGLAVNGLCSSAYDLCIGGTEFNDTANPSLYWSASNSSTTDSSALGYIPEVVWNESGGGGLWAGGGGSSAIYGKPAWQAGKGVPADSKRDVPDLSLAAAGHDGYLIELNGCLNVVGGTSAATPTLAGVFALLAQSTGARQGSANANLYALATRQNSNGPAVFHAIISGNNTVPGLTGYSATSGYDRASGLGSVDAAEMVSNWHIPPQSPSLALSLGETSLTASSLSASPIRVQVAASGGFNAPVALTTSGLPVGVRAAFGPAGIAAPGSGTSSLQLTIASTVPAGSYNFNVIAVGGSLTASAAVTLTISVPALSFSAAASSLILQPGGAASIQFVATANSAINSSVSLKATGLPAGVTAAFAPATIPAPGSGTSTLTLTAATTVAGGVYPITVTAAAGPLSRSVSISLHVPTLSASAGTSSLSIARGSSATLRLTAKVAGGFNASALVALTGLPAGVTATLAPSMIPAPGSGTCSISLQASSTAALGAAPITISLSGGGVVASVPVTLNVTAARASIFSPVSSHMWPQM